MIQKHEIIDKILDYFGEKEVSIIYLFGTVVRGEMREDSDIDVAVVLENINDFFEVQMLLMRLRRKIDLRIEPHPINIKDFNENNPFAHEIVTTGLEIN